MERPVQIIVNLYHLYTEKDNNVRHVRQTHKCFWKNKPKPTNNLKNSIELTHIVVRDKDLDGTNGNTLWQDTTNKEVDAMMDL